MMVVSRDSVASASLEVAELEKLWLRALKEQDLDTLRRVLHENFTSTPARSQGQIIGKSEYLSSVMQQEVCDYEIRDQIISEIYNDVVVKQHLICNLKFHEVDLRDDLLVTDVWIRTGTSWVAITRHASRMPSVESDPTK